MGTDTPRIYYIILSDQPFCALILWWMYAVLFARKSTYFVLTLICATKIKIIFIFVYMF